MTVIKVDLDPGLLPTIQIPEALDPDPTFAAALAALASGRISDCRRIISAATPEQRGRAGFAYLDALTCYAERNPTRCIEIADRIVAAIGPDPSLVLIIAVCSERIGDSTRAEAAYAGILMRSAQQAKSDDVLNAITSLAVAADTPLRQPLINAAALGLQRLNVFGRSPERLAQTFGDVANLIIVDPNFDVGRVSDLMSAIGVGRDAEPELTDVLLNQLVLPAIQALLAKGRTGDALNLELAAHETVTKSRETAAGFASLSRTLTPALAAAGRAIAATLPAMPRPRIANTYRIAFIAQTMADLAHIHVAIDIMAAIHATTGERLTCALFGLLGEDARISERCRNLGIEVMTSKTFGGDRARAEGLIIGLRRHLIANEYSAAVWITAAPTAAFALSIGLAPVQIFFAMKYHSFALDEVDAYLTGGPAGRERDVIDGRAWRVGQSCYTDLVDPSRSAEAARIRAEIGVDRVVLACIGREEKINSTTYLDAVAKLLRRHPKAIFLWTGRSRFHAIQSWLDHAGVGGQCRYIGWVDTRLYAQVADVLLDSFPFPCGVTALQAMAAAKPVVFFDSPEARETGVPVFIAPLLAGVSGTPAQQTRARTILSDSSGSSLFLLAQSPDDYVEMANRLILDAAFRTQVGDALKAFTAEFVTDVNACGLSYARHLIEAIEEKARTAAERQPLRTFWP